jgi:hypothetical protein
MLSIFSKQTAQACPQIISRFLKGMAALMPDIFSSRFYKKPRSPLGHLRPHWRPGKPRSLGR